LRIFRAVLEHGENGIFTLCRQLESDDQSVLEQAEYALNGLAVYTSRPENEKQRDIYLNAVYKALSRPSDFRTKSFLINQVQVCGTKASINVLKRFLDDAQLCGPSVQALLAISSTEAGAALLEALPRAGNSNKVTIINALGGMRYKPSAEMLMDYADDKNSSLREAACSALANFGYLPAANKLKSAAQDGPPYDHFYLTFAGRLYENGHADNCRAICKEVLANSEGKYSQNARKVSLSLLLDVSGEQAADELFKAAGDDDNKIRSAAINSAVKLNSPAMIQKWIDVAGKSQPPVQAEIINMLGRQGSKTTVPFLRESLNSKSSAVRQAAISAMGSILEKEAVNDLVTILKKPLDDDEAQVIKQTILSLTDSTFISELMVHFAGFSNSAKMLLISILAERGNGAYNSQLTAELNSDDNGLRSSVIKGLGRIGSDDDFDTLLIYLQRTENSAEQNASARTLAAILKRSKKKNQNIKKVIETYPEAAVPKKIILLSLFKKIGGPGLLKIVREEMSAKDNGLSEAAARSLFDWPDKSALELLTDTAKNSRDEKHRILAVRGALRILRENKLGDYSTLEHYSKLMESAARPDEKRQILAGLAEIETPSSFKLVLEQLKNKDINYEAFLSALQIAKFDRDKKENLKPEETALLVIDAHADEKLSEKIELYSKENTGSNIPPEGFTALFNGVDLTGWKGLVGNPVTRAKMSAAEAAEAQAEADKIMHKQWKAVDGLLYFIGEGFRNICTVKDYQDFELLLDWKIEKESDSGLYLRGVPQVQIWDFEQHKTGSGSLYNNQKNESKPQILADKPIGEWNRFRIIMKAERVTVYLNSKLVVDNVELENYWERDKPIYRSGQIEFQAHNSPLYFRNIFIRELPAEEPAFAGDLFNGKDLAGWQVINNKQDSWKVEDGILYTEGSGGGWISTEKEYGNFKLELEFRVPDGGNSGIFLRAPHAGDLAYSGMEVQVLDDYAEKYKDLKVWQYTGSIYGLQAPAKKVTKKYGEWQKMEITCDGPKVKVVLNDELINDASLIDFMHQEKGHPGIKRRKGYIGLQNHSTRVDYRNIRLTELK